MSLGFGLSPMHLRREYSDDALTRRSRSELQSFTDWLSTHGQQGLIGELGVPKNDIDWLRCMETYLIDVAGHGEDIWVCPWASGRAWGEAYTLACYIKSDAGTAIDLAEPITRIYQRAHLGWTNLSGWEYGATDNRTFGFHSIPLTDDFAFLASHGVTTVRLPMAWERLQRDLNGALDATTLTELDGILRAADAHGLRVLLDLHNYGRYKDKSSGTQVTYVLQTTGGSLNGTHLADVWVKLSQWVRADATRDRAVLGYDLMNEPHDFTAEGGGFTATRDIDDFESGVDEWLPTSTTTAVQSTAQAQHGTNSVFVTAATVGGSCTVHRSLHGEFDWSAFGPALSLWIYVDPSAANSQYFGAIQVQAHDFSFYSSTFQTCRRGQWSQIIWPNCPYIGQIRNIGFNFGSAPNKFYIDYVQQGNVAASLAVQQVWEVCAQAAVTALRTAGDTRLIVVEGFEWAHLERFAALHPAPFITDAANNLRYSTHHYWNVAGGGRDGATFSTYAAEVARAVTDGF